MARAEAIVARRLRCGSTPPSLGSLISERSFEVVEVCKIFGGARLQYAYVAGWEKGDGFSPFSRLPISSRVFTPFPLIVLDERSSLVEFSKSGPFP